MHVITDQHGPMLRRIRVAVNLLGDHLAEPRPLREPLARQSADRVPADEDLARLVIKFWVALGDDVGRRTEPNRFLQTRFTLREALLAGTSATITHVWDTHNSRAAMSRLRSRVGVSSREFGGEGMSVMVGDYCADA